MIHLKHKAAGLAFVAFAAIPANALPPIEVEAEAPTAVVSYADLDLTTPAGVATLNGRIRRAASGLCAPHRNQPDPFGSVDFRRCVRTALNDANGQLEQAIADAGNIQLASRGSIRLAARH